MLFQMTRESPFDFSMAEIKEKWGDVTGHDLVVKAWFYDWFMVDTQNATAVCHVIKDGIAVSLIGRDHRAFKPNQLITVYVSFFNFQMLTFLRNDLKMNGFL